MPKLKYEARKGTRIKDRFCGVSISYGSPYYGELHYCSDLCKWMTPNAVRTYFAGQEYSYGTHAHGVRTVRAFRRWLRKQRRYLPAGVQFVLESRYVGHNVTGVT